MDTAADLEERKQRAKRVRLTIDCSIEEKLIISKSAKKAGKTLSEHLLEIAREKIQELSQTHANKSTNKNNNGFDDFWETLGYK